MGLNLAVFADYFSNDPNNSMYYQNHSPFLDDLERWISLCSAAFERPSFISGFIDKKVYFLSDLFVEMIGYTHEEITEIGESFIHHIINPYDRIMVEKAHDAILRKEFKDNLEFNRYSSRYNLRIKNKNGEWLNLECTSYPIYEVNNQVHFSINYAKLSNKKLTLMYQIFFVQDNLRYIYHQKKDCFVVEKKIKLSDVEHQILINTARGLKEYEISREINMDVNSIKYYKKSILKKLSVTNMPEAIYFAFKENLI